MALDRDLNVALVGAAFPSDRSARALDLLAATGIRGLRLLRETEAFERVVLCERNPAAARVLAENARSAGADRAGAFRGDAARPPLIGGFGYVDVDPYGTPVPYLDAAIRLLAPGGALAVTATDMPVLCGVARGVAERRYGGRPLRGRLGPEGGLRLLLAEIARRARRRGLQARPLAAFVHDHHVRAMVRLAAPETPEDPVGTIDPARFDGPPLPAGGPYGPLWLGPLFDRAVVGAARTPARAAEPAAAERWLAWFRGESAVPAPFYYEANLLARELRLPEPPAPARVLAELAGLGWSAAPTHARPGAFRTLAPREEVHRAARAAARTS